MNLKDKHQIIAFLNDELSKEDPNCFVVALGEVIKENGGFTEISKKTGLGRESMYKTFSGNVIPNFFSIIKFLNILGLRIQISKKDNQ